MPYTFCDAVSIPISSLWLSIRSDTKRIYVWKKDVNSIKLNERAAIQKERTPQCWQRFCVQIVEADGTITLHCDHFDKSSSACLAMKKFNKTNQNRVSDQLKTKKKTASSLPNDELSSRVMKFTNGHVNDNHEVHNDCFNREQKSICGVFTFK